MSNTKPKPSTAKSCKDRKPHRLDADVPAANRKAVVVLEVLAGERTPLDAATLLGVAVPRYYQLETRALQGLVAALEPRPQGKQPTLEGRVRQLERALSVAQRECARQQALLRVAQRSMGIRTPAKVEGKATEKDRAGRRKRRPTVRALKAARVLAAQARTAEAEVLQQEGQGTPLATADAVGDGWLPSDAPDTEQGAVR